MPVKPIEPEIERIIKATIEEFGTCSYAVLGREAVMRIACYRTANLVEEQFKEYYREKRNP